MYYDTKLDVNYDNGLMNFGDFTRIKKAMAKALRGEKITVGFLGGSITQGCLSSTPETCYAYLVYRWWKENFPKSDITYVNAGIGGTPSDFGVARVDDDLLKYNPDFSIVEFSVNDVNNLYYFETYEGLVRHILTASQTGLMLVHNVRYDNMESAEDKHLVVGKYYELPCVSMKHSVYPQVANKTIDNREITQDDLHPNDAGHLLLANLIIHMLEIIRCDVVDQDADSEVSKELPVALTENSFEHSQRLQNTNYKAEMKGFEEDHTEQKNILEMFRHGYTAGKKGSSIVFYAECTSVAVQFRKSVNKPTPIAEVIVDDDEKTKKILDGNFDEDWGDCLYTENICAHMDRKNHKIEIKLTETHDNDVVPFYLVSVIASY